MTFGLVAFPESGAWRIGRATDPIRWHRPAAVDSTDATAGGGNRFDSFHGDYGTLYCGSTPEVCYAETLARMRPNARLAELARQDWQDSGYMAASNIAADWRDSRVLVRVAIDGALPFVDMSSSATLQSFYSDRRIRGYLTAWGVGDLDLANLVGTDRRVTRLLSQSVAESVTEADKPMYGGVRYVSRLGANYECWAVFEPTEFTIVARRPILRSDTALQRVAASFGLTVH